MTFQFQALLLFCQISFYFSTVHGAACGPDTKDIKDFCKNPVTSDNPVDLKWLHAHFEDGWNLQFGSAVGRGRLAKFIKGVGNMEVDDYSELCATMKLDYVDDHFAGLYSGYGGKEALFNCTSTFACNFTSSDKLAEIPIQAHISYFDGKGKEEHNMISIVTCIGDDEPSWFVITVSKTISEEETKTITEHLQTIGMDTDNKVPYRAESCK